MSIDYLENSRYLGKPITFYLVEGAGDSPEETQIGPFGFCDGEEDFELPWITRLVDGVEVPVVFRAWPISDGTLSEDGTLDKSNLTINMALGTPLDDMFLAYPPSQVVNMTVYQGHVGDEQIQSNYPAKWIGRILSGSWKENEMVLDCQPVSSSVKRPGLRRNYQVGCPHVLYGSQCRANRAAATIVKTVSSISRNRISLTETVGTNYALYLGGLAEWTNANNGIKEIRTISSITGDGATITIRGVMRGLAPGAAVSLVRGCNRLMSGCYSHGNILNYGGQPFIPLENPLSTKNQFY